jgi:flagellin
MPGIGGLSIANNLLSNQASLNLNRNQSALGVAVQRLSSGLRINTAADDPSGLAIAETLQSQVNGFDQGARNVQDATNAAQVAEGALSTTTDILQRIRTLAVEGSSDITSTQDRSNLQAEVSQLLLEVNRISQDTNFNGQALLDGTHSGFQQAVDASVQITANADLAGGGTLITPASVNVAAGLATTVSGPCDGTIEVQVAQFTSTQQGLIISFFTSASTTGSAVVTNVTVSSTGYAGGVTVIDNVCINFGTIGTLDVGVTSYVKVAQFVSANSNPNGPAFNFQSGAAEGATIQVGFIQTSTNNLRIANVNLVGATGFGSLASEDAIGQIDNALQTVLAQRATLGATIVRLQEDLNNDNVASVNLQASESAIRDLNVGSETTQYTKLQILVQVGTSVLAQSNQVVSLSWQ